jgi:hypothetical protein
MVGCYLTLSRYLRLKLLPTGRLVVMPHYFLVSGWKLHRDV